MTIIDIEKFICSLIEKTSGFNTHVYHCDLLNALKEQGLEYKDGEIVKTQRRIAAEAKEAIFDNEDEKIKKRIYNYINVTLDDNESAEKEKWLAWIEKQGEKHISSTPIWKHWKGGVAGNGDGTPIYLVKTGIIYSITSCLGFECDYVELSELDKLLSEKQGEQKVSVDDFKAKNWYVSEVDGKIHDMTYNPTDKDEPKFKVGDWIIRSAEGFKHNTYLITEVKDYYVCEELKGRRVTFTFNDVHNNFKLWDISDAKDGDVLVDKNYMGESPFIFKETKPSNIKTDVPNPLTVLGYCGIGGAGFTKSSGWGDTANCIYYPATKEQRDLLFQKMKEEGYEWDAEKKELKKINSYCQENCKGYQETGKCFADGGCDAKRKAEQKSTAWSEKDDKAIESLLHTLDSIEDEWFHDMSEEKYWLKSIKNRLTTE